MLKARRRKKTKLAHIGNQTGSILTKLKIIITKQSVQLDSKLTYTVCSLPILRIIKYYKCTLRREHLLNRLSLQPQVTSNSIAYAKWWYHSLNETTELNTLPTI